MQFKHLFLTITFFLNLLLASFAQEPTLLEHGGGVLTVKFSPVDASLVASAGESHIIKLWNLQNDTVRTFVGHTSRVNSIAFSPNGELLVSVSDDRTLRLWSVQSQQNIATQNVTDRYQSIDFSPDGRMLATGGGRHVKLWNSRNQTEIATLQHDQDVRTVAFSPDGQLLAAGDGSGNGPGTVKVWDIERRQVVVSLNANPKSVKAVEFSSDNRYLASSGWNGYLKVWDVSNWAELWTLRDIGHRDFAFSPDAKVIVSSSGKGSVNLYWVEDGTNVAVLSELGGWRHPVDFSLDGSFALGAEDGKIRIWRIDTSPVDGREAGAVPILHIDTYFQELAKANAANADNIPEPVPPPAIVRDFFDLDPFYEQWINVGGLPIIASGKVNPYAIKEAAWLIEKMVGHRQDVLHAMIENKIRFVVIGYTEMTTQIPEYRSLRPAFYWDRRTRGKGGCTEENLLDYPGDTAPNSYQLIHGFAHTIHHMGLNTVDPEFDARLKIVYDAAMKKGLWRGTYAASNRSEYWAEGTHAWIDPKGGSSFKRVHGGNTRAELKTYDPGLATLLTEIYGDGEWRYTPIVTRTHLSHLRGFNPQDSPAFKWPEKLEEAYARLRNPDIDSGDEWVNLNLYKPSQLSHLNKSRARGTRTHVLLVNLAEIDVLVYQVHPDGTETFIKRIYAKRGLRHAEIFNSHVGDVYLIKDQETQNLAVFRAEEQTGRAVIGALSNKTDRVTRENLKPQVLVDPSQRLLMFWVDVSTGTIHRLVGAKVETLVPSVRNATRLAVDMAHKKLYWTEKTSDRTGRIRRANLDGTNVEFVRNLTSVPLDIALDTIDRKLYLTNSWGKVQRLNLDGSNFQPNLITGLQSPNHLALDVARGKVYWTEQTGNTTGKIQRASLDGTNVEFVKNLTSAPRGITVDSVNGKIYLTNDWGKIQRLNLDGSNFQPNLITGLQSPREITVDVVDAKLYWTEQRRIRRANLNGKNIQDIVTGLGTPIGVTLGIPSVHTPIPAAPTTTIVPEQTLILANYPNPFNPETWIPYQLSKPAEVTLHIYAVNGALIRTLALGYQPAGMYQNKSRAAYWDGKNALGEPVASGMYFYTLTAADFTATRKMLIRK